MTIYLILKLAVAACCPTGNSWLNVTPTSNTLGTFNSTPIITLCGGSTPAEVSFVRSGADAEAVLSDSNYRVWKVSTLPFKISELRREAKTTYSVSETPLEVK